MHLRQPEYRFVKKRTVEFMPEVVSCYSNRWLITSMDVEQMLAGISVVVSAVTNLLQNNAALTVKVK